MKRSFRFSAVSSLLIIAFLFTINYLTSWSHPWFIYPTFVVLWWPMSVYFAAIKRFDLYSISASILTTVFFVLINYITSPSYPWFIFPVFAVLWWPMAMYFPAKGRKKIFSVVAALYTCAFFLVINLVSSPTVVWFIYPCFAVLWWPISYIACSAKKYKLFSVIASLYTIGFFALVNFITSPSYIWFYYPSYAVLWWPISMFFLKKNKFRAKAYSIVMTTVTMALLALINIQNSPDYIWFHYTIFYLLWWPVVMLLGKKAASTWFAVIGAAAIIAYHTALYYIQMPVHPWPLYIVLPALWWPVCMALRKHIHRVWFLLLSFVVFGAYYITLNMIIYPQYLWAIYILCPEIIAVISMYYANKKRPFAYSIWVSAVLVVFFVTVNYISSPQVIWAIYPTFAIAWWPLSVYFYKAKKMKKNSELKEA